MRYRNHILHGETRGSFYRGDQNLYDTKADALSVIAIANLLLTPPLPFGRICFVVLVMRKGGENS